MNNWEERFRQRFTFLNDANSEGGYNAKEQVIEFIKDLLEENTKENEPTKTMPCFQCKKDFKWEELVRVRCRGMWCGTCLEYEREDLENEREAGGTMAGGVV